MRKQALFGIEGFDGRLEAEGTPLNCGVVREFVCAFQLSSVGDPLWGSQTWVGCGSHDRDMPHWTSGGTAWSTSWLRTAWVTGTWLP